MIMIAVTVEDQSQVADARRKATDIAGRHGFNDTDTGRAALVATELATNLIKHGGGGEVLVGTYDDGHTNGVEFLALDKGPGMADVPACLADGYSSAGTAGHGLGAVVRQSHFVDVASWPGVGTAVLARVVASMPKPAVHPAGPTWGAVAIPMRGETVCGDAWSVADETPGRTLLLADGLGHGPDAAEAAVEAVRLFHRFGGHQVPALLDYIHGGLRSTRGAAVSIGRFDATARKIVFAGIGNVAGVLAMDGQLRRMVSMPGTAGHVARKIQAFDYPFEKGLVILYSDGLQTSWTLDAYRGGLASFHPTLIAGVLYRDLTRRRDDTTVLVGKW
jgi:anti-sigma regulatory factor (Ser/Thr protein kinase)